MQKNLNVPSSPLQGGRRGGFRGVALRAFLETGGKCKKEENQSFPEKAEGI